MSIKKTTLSITVFIFVLFTNSTFAVETTVESESTLSIEERSRVIESKIVGVDSDCRCDNPSVHGYTTCLFGVLLLETKLNYLIDDGGWFKSESFVPGSSVKVSSYRASDYRFWAEPALAKNLCDAKLAMVKLEVAKLEAVKR